MLKAYKYRLYPNEEQKIQLSKTFGCVRFVYNYYLAKKIELYKTEQKHMSKIDCNNHCNKELKSEFVWLKLKIFQSFYFTTRAQGFSSYSSSNTLINYGIIISYIEALKSCKL